MLAVVLVVEGIAISKGLGELDARTLTFTSLVLANLGLIMANRSWSRTMLGMLRFPNAALWWVMSGTLIFLSLALYAPFMRHLFRFNPLHPNDAAVCLAAGLLCVGWFEFLKVLNRKKTERVHKNIAY